jgi:hypothetical protein
MFYVIGDSHTRSFAFNSNFTPLFLGQGKEINFASEENFEKVKATAWNALSNISETDQVIVFIGEPDTRFYLNAGWYPWDNEEKVTIDNFKNNVQLSISRYRKFIQLLKQKFNQRLFILNVIPSGRPLQNIIVDEFNKELKKICNLESVVFIEINEHIYTDSTHSSVKPEYVSDHVHLNNKIQLLAQNFLKEMGMSLNDSFNNSVKWDNSAVHKMFVYDEKFGCYKMEKKLEVIDPKSILLTKQNASKQSVLDKLREFGIVSIDKYISTQEVDKLVAEFKSIMHLPSSEWLEVRPYSLGQAALLTNNNKMGENVPNTYKFFNDPFMKEITDRYLGKGYNSNRKIFVVKDVVGTVHHANDLHFDVQRTLKFFLYLTDTTEVNGAFRCVPGSHKEAEKIRKENPGQISYENREFSRKLPYGPEHTISVNGKAGSLIIFDTNVFHQAGKVSKGERWVMRGQTEQVKEEKKNISFFQRVLNKLSK